MYRLQSGGSGRRLTTRRHVIQHQLDDNKAEPTTKAVKADNAKVPVHLWNDRVVEKLEAEWAERRRKIVEKLEDE